MKIRVLETLASLRRAGAEHVAVSIARGLDRDRFEPRVVSLFPAFEGGYEGALERDGVPVEHLDKRPGLDPRMWFRLAKTIREFRPHVVHTHSYVMRYAWPARMMTGRGPLVHTVHNLAEKEVDWAGRAIHRVAFRTGTLPVAISREVARSFERVYGFAPAATIPNGADVRNGFRPEARERWRRANGFEAGDFLVASVARFEPQKNPLGLIEAFARGLVGHSGARLVMAGQGSLLEPCRRRAAELGVEARVHFAGLCQDVPELLSACDLFALASDWEGASVAIVEAMAARLPVVATLVGGVPELVVEGETGLLVPPGEVEAFSAAINTLACDPARRRAMADAAERRALLFETGAMVKAYGEVFERAAERSGAAR